MTVELLTVKDIVRVTQLSAYTVRAAVRALELPATKLRGRILVHPDDLAGWIDAGRVGAPPAAGDRVPCPSPRPRRDPPPGGYTALFRDQGRAA